MEKLVPYLLLIMGLGAAALALGGLLRLRRDRPEFWILGLGVRTRAGACKVLVVSALLLLLAYSSYRRGSIQPFFDPHPLDMQQQLDSVQQQLARAQSQIEEFKAQVAALAQEKENCQQIVSRQGLGMASRSDAAAELHASLSAKQRDIAALQAALGKTRTELEALKADHEALVQAAGEAKEKTGALESQMDVLKNEKDSLALKLESLAKANDTEGQRLKEENNRLKAQYREQDRRAGLLRQGLVLREANDWALEQEIQRLANLLADQPEINTPRQTDIARSLQKISQVLREGQALTKQAKTADSKPPSPVRDKTVSAPEKKK